MFRRAIKQLLAGLIYYLGLRRLILALRSGQRSRPLILMYHSVLPAADPRCQLLQPGLMVTPEHFEKQMKFLSERYQATKLDDLEFVREEASEMSSKQFAITFDDGWRDNYEFAMSILTQLKIPATVFLSTDFIGSLSPFWFVRAKFLIDRLEQKTIIEILKQNDLFSNEKTELAYHTADFDRFAEFLKQIKPPLTEALLDQLSSAVDDSLPVTRWVIDYTEAREMTIHGFSFGSHGQSHSVLTELELEEVARELNESRRVISEELNLKVDLLAYPNGNCNPDIKRLAREAGYRLAFVANRTNETEGHDLMALPRVAIHGGVSKGVAGGFSKALFACHLDGLL